MENVLKSGYYKSPLSYNNVDWFVYEVKKLEYEMTVYFVNTNEDVIMTEEDGKECRNNNIC